MILNRNDFIPPVPDEFIDFTSQRNKMQMLKYNFKTFNFKYISEVYSSLSGMTNLFFLLLSLVARLRWPRLARGGSRIPECMGCDGGVEVQGEERNTIINSLIFDFLISN